jgi:hypothetical protein
MISHKVWSGCVTRDGVGTDESCASGFTLSRDIVEDDIIERCAIGAGILHRHSISNRISCDDTTGGDCGEDIIDTLIACYRHGISICSEDFFFDGDATSTVTLTYDTLIGRLTVVGCS